jgi:hypothetical protein
VEQTLYHLAGIGHAVPKEAEQREKAGEREDDYQGGEEDSFETPVVTMLMSH